MGFSNTNTEGDTSFGGAITDTFAKKYPVASTIGNTAGLFGGDKTPQATLPSQDLPNYSGMTMSQPDLIAMNAQPKKNGEGLSAIFKAIMGI